MACKDIVAMLKGGDRRSIGSSDRVVKLVSADARQFAALVRALRSEDLLIRMRAADAAEKVSRARPELLRRHKRELLALFAEATQQELRWHLAAMIPRLP